MKSTEHLFPWLGLMDRPAFCMKDGVVIATNSAAENRMLRVGMDISQIVTDHRAAYDELTSGCLYLTITAGDVPCSASVTRTKDFDLFLIQYESDHDQLQALALAAQQLRIPMANLMAVSDRLLSNLDDTDSAVQQQSSQINHNLFQLLRIISNMSDAASYVSQSTKGMQTVDLSAVIDEIIEKSQTLSADTGITIAYTGLDAPVFGLANAEKLERAIYNLLSNALKFSPDSSTVEVSLSKHGNMLSFSVCNQNLAETETGSFWNRYQREPAIEDSRYGLGLGMTLVRSVAAAHKGTLLIDHPSDNQTRITMSIAIMKNNSGTLRSPVMHIGDYAGGRDKGLLELAEILPVKSYENIN